MHHLNYSNEDLLFYSFKNYLVNKNTKIVAESKEIKKQKYQLFLEKRKKIIEEIKHLRNEIIDKGEEILYQKKSTKSKSILDSKINNQKTDSNKSITKLSNKISKNNNTTKSTLTQEKKSYESQIEQEKLAIKNIKNRKNKEVLNMFEYYLKKIIYNKIQIIK